MVGFDAAPTQSQAAAETALVGFESELTGMPLNLRASASSRTRLVASMARADLSDGIFASSGADFFKCCPYQIKPDAHFTAMSV